MVCERRHGRGRVLGSEKGLAALEKDYKEVDCAEAEGDEKGEEYWNWKNHRGQN